MKAGLLLSFAALAVAQPFRRELPDVVKRDVVEITQTTVVTETAPAVVVYVDQNGHQIDESTGAPVAHWQADHTDHTHWTHATSTTPAAAPTPTTTTTTPPADTPTTTTPPPQAPTTTVAPPAATTTSTTAQQAAPSPDPAPVSSSGLGISYAAFKVGPCGDNTCNGVCKTSAEITSDIAALSSYPLIRLYGVECNQVAVALSAIGANQKLFVGVYNLDTLDTDTSSLEQQVGNQWSKIDTVAVGNEDVAGGTLAATVLTDVTLTRAKLAMAGYKGTVTTVDVVNSYVNNQALCAASGSDGKIYANIHAFFGGGASADAGKNVQSEIDRLSAACGGAPVVVTESGWPWKGQTNNDAIPSPADQTTAINSLKAAFSKDFVLFSAYNDYWKQNNQYTFDAEQYWGIDGDGSSN